MQKNLILFVLLVLSTPLFSQDKEDIIEILNLFSSDNESAVFFNNDTPYGRALYLEINPILGNRRSRSDAALLAFHDLTEDDLRGFDRPILINQQEEQFINEVEADLNSASAPKFAIVSIGNRNDGIFLIIQNAAYQEFGYAYHGQFQFQKVDDKWEIINKKIKKARF